MILSRHGIHRSPHQFVYRPVWFRSDRVIDVIKPLLLGDQEPAGIVGVTTDTTPELKFRWPAAAPATIQLTDGTTPYGPFPVVGDTVNVGTALPPGVYSVIGTAADSDGNLVNIGGSIRIITDSTSLLIGNTMTLMIGTTTDLLIADS